MKRLIAFLGLFFCVTHVSRAQQHPISCGKNPNATGIEGCTVTKFDRTQNQIEPNPDQWTLDNYVAIIRGAGTKVLYSGTILDVKMDPTAECKNLDWRVVAMARESSNIVIYGPADVSEFCNPEPKNKDPKEKEIVAMHLVVVLPVKVIWAELYGHTGNLSDPFRKIPAPITAATAGDGYCGGSPHGFETVDSNQKPLTNPKHSPPFSAGSDIRTCDRYSWIKFMYNPPAGTLWNSWTQPGASTGSISYTPGVGKIPNLTGGPAGDKAPAQSFTLDIQEYPSGKLGPGYIGAPVVFEKSNASTANLNSLVFGISYDLPLAMNHKTLDAGKHPWKIFVRPPDLRLQYGPEMAVSTPHDMNVTAAFVARLPIGINMPRQPSVLTIFPVVGVEGGNHVITHLVEPDPILRKVAGYDTSLRVPFIATHAFFGDKPTTIDFSWRTRYLSYNEPFTDFVSGYAERLTKVQRSYWRGSFVVPFSSLASFKVSVQHGGLPPSFDYLGYSVNVGLTLGNPGYTEHEAQG